MTKLFESMTKCATKYFKIRVWRQEDTIKMGPDLEILQLCLDDNYLFHASSAEYIIEKLSDLPRVNAVEVLAQDNNGVVVYNDWP